LLALKTEEEPSPSLVPTNKNPQINEWKHYTLPFGSLENLNE
jgi:hypothetical protein